MSVTTRFTESFTCEQSAPLLVNRVVHRRTILSKQLFTCEATGDGAFTRFVSRRFATVTGGRKFNRFLSTFARGGQRKGTYCVTLCHCTHLSLYTSDTYFAAACPTTLRYPRSHNLDTARDSTPRGLDAYNGSIVNMLKRGTRFV
eukprot:4825579-Pyramimonas_sp.AAC.1